MWMRWQLRWHEWKFWIELDLMYLLIFYGFNNGDQSVVYVRLLSDCIYLYLYIMLNIEDGFGYLLQSILHTHHTINFAHVTKQYLI